MTSHERAFRQICQGMLAIGVKPTPTTLNRFLQRSRHKLNNINGRETQWRREELLSAGWLEPMTYLDLDHNIDSYGTWQRPA